MTMQVLDEADVRRIAREELAHPAYVTQRSVEQAVGLPRRDYLRLSRAGAWPTTRERRLVLARTADVVAYVEQRISLRETRPQNDHGAETVALARVGARRVAR